MFKLQRRRRKARARTDGSSLGNLLVELGYCSTAQIDAFVTEQDELLLGQVLLDNNIITTEQLEHALLRQQVLRGQDEPGKLRSYGSEKRRQAMQELGQRIEQAARSTGQLAAKLTR